MTSTIYTIGYTGKKIEDIIRALDARNAILLDIRYSPASRNPVWCRSRLQAALPGRYEHVKALGNKNYKTGGPIEILDYQTGRKVITDSKHPVILLCACSDPAGCHRTTVATLLRADGFLVEEVGHDHKDHAYQQRLF